MKLQLKALKRNSKTPLDILDVEEVHTKLNARFKRINKQNEKNEDERGIPSRRVRQEENPSLQELRETWT